MGWIGKYFSGPLFGSLSDRFGRKPVLMSVFLLHTLAYLIIAFRLPDIFAYLSIFLWGSAFGAFPRLWRRRSAIIWAQTVPQLRSAPSHSSSAWGRSRDQAWLACWRIIPVPLPGFRHGCGDDDSWDGYEPGIATPGAGDVKAPFILSHSPITGEVKNGKPHF